VMQCYGPERPSGQGAPGRNIGEETDDPQGKTLIIRQLQSGRDTSFGNVSQYDWQNAENSHLIAMTISAEDKTGNGIHLFDPETGVLRVLDSSPSVYTGLIWRKDSEDLAVFKAVTDKKKDGPTQVVLSWTGLGLTERFFSFDPTSDSTFPADKRIVPFRPLSWSADGNVLFFGIASWVDTSIPPENEENIEKDSVIDEPATIEIWHWKDVFVMPWQKIHADQDRRRNMLTAWHIDRGTFVQLGRDAINEQVEPIPGTKLAYVVEWSKYAMERSIGRTGADLYLQDISTGERTKLRDNINDRYLSAGPGGKTLLFLENDHYWTVDLATSAVTNITESAPVSFIDLESDETSKVYPDKLQKPPFGVAGWTDGDAEVLLYNTFDLWKIAADGSKAERLTFGAEDQVRHRLIRLDLTGNRGRRMSGNSDPEKAVDFSRSVYLSLYGEWTKKSGFARMEPEGDVTPLVWLDKNVGSLAKAENAEVYGYIIQDFDDSPDIFVCESDFKKAKPVTATNPFQSNFAWGRSELITYMTDKGRKLQGALFYPAGFDPDKKYPMIVYNYELLSPNVHRYVAPSDRSYYNISVFTSQGYIVFEPDIVFRPRQPGWSVVECITAGVKKVIEMGLVDPERIGIIGHSMGGFNSAFVATHTDGIFAAAVAGAPIIDMVSYYGDHHW
ncbi:MAG: prolyl oligopeptidase family serine peptidase, partial [Candidatus Aminicenantes bacterium]|nr:prolyl oligopeptidase family serine peptidase [Candidatus Aminicenantes bacterium]